VRKIVVGELLSLDGVAEDPNRFFTEWDDVVDASIPRLIHPGCGHPRPSQLRRVGGILARQRDRAVRDVYQRGREARRNLRAA
jgi:hypothetical protein